VQDEKELLDNNCCPIHQKPCVSRKEDNYFFALSKYQTSLEEILNKNPNFVQPSYRLNEVKEYEVPFYLIGIIYKFPLSVCYIPHILQFKPT
jgi:methionyl-tRNA synthetase